MKLLRQAVSEVCRDMLYLKEGADLAPLRQRDGFKKLLAELEKTKASPAVKVKWLADIVRHAERTRRDRQ